MSREEALAKAREMNTDLIEISPNATPPVAKLLPWDKFRYQQEKAKKKEQAAARASGESKQIQISVRAATHDLEIALKKLEGFLKEGLRVDIQMRMRGREKANPAWAMQKMEDFLGMIRTEYRVISPPRPAGNGLNAQIAPKN